jgi:hypothetical protein
VRNQEGYKIRLVLTFGMILIIITLVKSSLSIKSSASDVHVYCQPEKSHKIVLKNVNSGWSWWGTPIIPATQEADTGGLQFEASLDKISRRHYLKGKQDWRLGAGGCWLKW